MTGTAVPEWSSALEHAVRADGPRVLATLIRHVGGDFALAEDALQDAYADAAVAWPRDGVPRTPIAWLTTAARRRAVDRLRRARAQEERARRLERLAALEPPADPMADEEAERAGERSGALRDDRLRLIFTCCHPALALPARVALTVKSLGGLTTAETAHAFLVSEAAMHQRLVRAKRKIAAAGIPYRVPPAHLLQERLEGVQHVLYVIFTEGHTASSGKALVRADLCAEAIRLARLLRRELPEDAETLGLLALMLLTDARRAARTEPDGRPVDLAEQDRGRWDARAIAEGLQALERASALGRPGPHQLKARIAAVHAAAPSFAETDWHRIGALYARLHAYEPTPVVAVNLAVAAGFAEGAAAGLALLDRLQHEPALAAYTPLHAARAEMLRRAGRRHDAQAAYARAISTSANEAQRADLAARRARLSEPGG